MLSRALQRPGRQLLLPVCAGAGYPDAQGDTLVARIGYVPAANIAVDDRGNEIAPTIDMATSIQLYTLKERGATWKLVSIEDDNG